MVVYNLGVALTAQEQENYGYWSEIWTATNARFGNDAALASSCIASRDNRLAYALSMGWFPEIEGGKKHRWSPQVLGKAANMWLRAGNKCQEILTHALNKYIAAIRIARAQEAATIIYSDSSAFIADAAWRLSWHYARPCHSKLTSQQREITTVKHYKTKPDVSTTKFKTVGAATLRREAVEAFVLPAGPVRVLCLSRLPDYDSRLRGAPLLLNTSGNTELTELLQPQVCVYLHCLGTYETSRLIRKQRGIEVINVLSISEIQL